MLSCKNLDKSLNFAVIPIRLVDGNTNASGRVEIYHNGYYGTVCSSSFDRLDLTVVCSMLGFENIPYGIYSDKPSELFTETRIKMCKEIHDIFDPFFDFSFFSRVLKFEISFVSILESQLHIHVPI